MARIREFLREPEVIFWVFAFPILLVCALGIAFRNTAPEKIRVAVERNDATAAASTALSGSAFTLSRHRSPAAFASRSDAGAQKR